MQIHTSGAEAEDVVIGPREQLFHLLAEAAEIEHTLMCSYLYMAFSLKPGSVPEFSPAEAQAVDRWRKVIQGVAIEEMAHLLIVANLSIAIGGRPHFGRPNFPVAPGYFPSGVIVKLTPFSAETLDHVIFLERPRGVAGQDGEGFQPTDDYRRQQAYHGLMPSVQDYATVGDLYDALRANLQASAQRLGDARLFVGPGSAQIAGATVDIDGVSVITSLASAMAAIDTIVEQGEGSPSHRDTSHYERFRGIRTEYQQLLEMNPEFRPAWPCAANPVMRRPPEPEDKVFIDHPDTAPLLDLANAVYSVLLRLLVQGFGRQTADAVQVQRRYLAAAIQLMHVLGKAGAALASMPASIGAPDVNAGMTFTMLRSVEPLLVGSAERQLVEERMDELRAGALQLVQAGQAPATLLASIEKSQAALEFGSLSR